MHYILKFVLICVCLLIPIITYAQKAKKILQTISIDSTILSVDVQQNNNTAKDGDEKFYSIEYWEGNSVVIESTINSEARPVVESSISDYIPLVHQKVNRLLVELSNESKGMTYIDGKLIKFRFSYKILMPERFRK